MAFDGTLKQGLAVQRTVALLNLFPDTDTTDVADDGTFT